MADALLRSSYDARWRRSSRGSTRTGPGPPPAAAVGSCATWPSTCTPTACARWSPCTPPPGASPTATTSPTGAAGAPTPDTDASIRTATRVEASPYSWTALQERYAEAAAAAVRAASGTDPAAVVSTQGHALTVADLASTLVVESTLHHLDLVRHLDGAPGPPASGLSEVRRVATALLDRDLDGWGDERVALVATGRATPTAQELEDLGGALVPVFT